MSNFIRNEITDEALDSIVGGLISYNADSLNIQGSSVIYDYNGYTKDEIKAVHKKLVGYSDDAVIKYLLENNYIVAKS